MLREVLLQEWLLVVVLIGVEWTGWGVQIKCQSISVTCKYRQGMCWNIVISTFQIISTWRRSNFICWHVEMLLECWLGQCCTHCWALLLFVQLACRQVSTPIIIHNLAWSQATHQLQQKQHLEFYQIHQLACFVNFEMVVIRWCDQIHPVGPRCSKNCCNCWDLVWPHDDSLDIFFQNQQHEPLHYYLIRYQRPNKKRGLMIELLVYAENYFPRISILMLVLFFVYFMFKAGSTLLFYIMLCCKIVGARNDVGKIRIV